MAGTVVDEFIVKYSLDTSGIAKGAKDVEARLEELRNNAGRAGDGLGSAVEAGAKRATGSLGALGSMLGRGGVVGLALGALVYVGKKVDEKMLGIAQSVRQLGIDSRNFDISVAGLRNLQNASEMVGGAMEDATQSVGGLKQSLFNLKFNGQVSESLVMLARLGVQFQDSYGRARDFNDIMLDTATNLEKMQKSGRMTQGEAFQAANQAGFTGGMAQLVTGGRAGVEAEIALQKGRRQVTGTDVGQATKLVRSATNLDQGAMASIGIPAMAKSADLLSGIRDGIVHIGAVLDKAFVHQTGSTARGTQSSAAAVGAGTVHHAGRGGGSFSGGGSVASRTGGGAYSSDIVAAAKAYGIPTEVLTGLIRTESNFDPGATNKGTGAKGLAQLMPETGKMLGVVPGKDPKADINAAAKYLAQLKASGLRQGMSDQMAMAYAVDAYHTGAGNLSKGTNIGPESRGYAGKVLAGTGLESVPRPWMDGGGAAAGNTDVQIGSINVYTPSTDPMNHANTIAAVTKRKLLTANAESGVQ